MSMSRRALLSASATAALVGVTGLPALADQKVHPITRGRLFGDLVDMGDLALPKGFTFERVGTIGSEALLDNPGGLTVGVTPSNLDGAGCFQHGNLLRMVRNHEVRPRGSVPVPLVAGTVYDEAAAMGGCTVVEMGRDGAFRQQWVGLSGTIRNCAGGVTPWGSWLSCEEDTTKAGGTSGGVVVAQDHGYVFEVFPDAAAKQIPVPIKAWGRGVWEGACIDPTRTQAYLTEDARGGLFYRWTAPEGRPMKPRLALQYGPDEGVLEALAVLADDGTPYGHYSELTAADLDRPLRTRWVTPDVEDRQAQVTDLRAQFTGVTVHAKIEGCWSDGKGVWFTCAYAYDSEAARYPDLDLTTNQGMVFFYDFKAETITLKEYYEIGHRFDGPDNIVVSPFGTIVIAEDGDDESHLISWTPGLGSQALALNLVNDSEWAGPVFAPQGDVLFASIQNTATYAIRGDFKRYLNGR